ncbi:MAG TPA: hypothetical protein VN279_01275 [Rhodocyclaceae bacterium]|nr:hypothetical protein [Rhodocyclaceae bacterium]
MGAHIADEAHRSLYDFIDGYPPDKQEKATRTVLEQAEVLSEAWVAA